MPRDRNQVADTDDARDQILAAAESCFERYGIAKTTMEDIAKAAGVSRPLVYRYFDDRDSLILEVVLRHSRKLIEEAHRHLAKQASFANVLTEGLLFILTAARQDQYLQLVFSSENLGLAHRILGSSDTIIGLVTEFWGPLLVEAQERGEVPEDLDRAEACRWLLFVTLTLVGRADLSPDDTDAYRTMVRRYVVPAFVSGEPAA